MRPPGCGNGIAGSVEVLQLVEGERTFSQNFDGEVGGSPVASITLMGARRSAKECHVGFQVAMDDALLVSSFERLSDLPRETATIFDRQRAAGQLIGERAALDEFHDEDMASAPSSSRSGRP
jgi:hypothetical protein